MISIVLYRNVCSSDMLSYYVISGIRNVMSVIWNLIVCMMCCLMVCVVFVCCCFYVLKLRLYRKLMMMFVVEIIMLSSLFVVVFVLFNMLSIDDVMRMLSILNIMM